jgi:thiosulfate/3-mercaptopyruvate sulfurtransferase
MAGRSALRPPLVSVEALATHLGDPAIVVIDVRWVLGQPGAGRRVYETGHIAGAIFLDLDSDLVAGNGPGRHPLPEPAEFEAMLAARGVGDRTFVVAYDDVGGWVAARLWWMLDDLGHAAVGVLDGGYPAWVAAGFPVSREVPTPPNRPADLHLAKAWRKVVDREALKSRLGSVVLLDARAGERYRGEVEPIDPVAGHIPTARSAPTAGNLAPDGRFLPPAQLRARFAALGCGPDGTVTSCGSGVSACHHALAMRIAGLPDPLLYPGSFSDWSRSGEQVAVGAEAGPATLIARGGHDR